MKKRKMTALLLSLASMLAPMAMNAQSEIEYEAGLTATGGNGEFVPYYMMNNRYGTLSQSNSVLVNAKIKQDMDTTKRFSYGFGAEVWGGWSSSVDYDRYDAQSATWGKNAQHPSRVWLQQLYGEVKYRGVNLCIGVKEYRNSLLDGQLSSGDITLSGNARPMPGVRAGFIDFQDIPFTNGWVQINGEVAYYKDMQDSWLENHYGYYGQFLTTGSYTNYRKAYFRTKPSERFSVTVGMQMSSQFLGKRTTYVNGKIDPTATDELKTNLEAFWKVFIPYFGGTGDAEGAANFMYGNHLGSWDLLARYELNDKSTLKAYWQSPFEDGSGIGKMNGFDGLYGIEYRSSSKNALTGVVVEYLDFTNQSGAIHWAPNDFPGTPLTDEATGADNYYNNYYYNGYANHGQSIGSPMLTSPIYNTDGMLFFRDNRVRGFHVAATGYIMPGLSYRVMGGYRKSWGTPYVPSLEVRECTSMMLEGEYHPKAMPQLSIKGQVAFDSGNMIGDRFGALVSVAYRGSVNKLFKK